VTSQVILEAYSLASKSAVALYRTIYLVLLMPALAATCMAGIYVFHDAT
jgi:hypothetical protein